MSEQYKSAGVDLHAGYEAVSRIKGHIEKTRIPGVMGQLGGFGGLFDLSSQNIKEPVLVSGTDGVGTKLMLAFELDKHDTIGIDVVAMCVNDIVTQGAKPLFFLDYIACGKLEPRQVEEIVAGVSEGCILAGCALIGGETAEMPGMYKGNEYDIAGFSVGVVEKQKRVTGEDIVSGDVLIGLPSSGVHSNGFSLVRKIIADNSLSLRETYKRFDKSLGEILLTPTRIYVNQVLSVMEKYKVKGMAHITGGGFYENIPRMFSKGLGASIVKDSWEIPPIFEFLKEQGSLSEEEMFNVFNMGIGLILVLSKDEADDALAHLHFQGEKAKIIGEVVKGEGVSFKEKV